ncbi:MAG: vanadium-dependent haloperoxidase [Saprospiraceae bacterium]|nr:vanadium-dependent haloperoxidase [Saprospiraceae bacterium]
MSYKLPVCAALAMLLWFPGCKEYNKDYPKQADNPEFLHAGVRRITEIIRHDIFAPPISARIYAYSTVAGYEALIPGFPEYQSLAGQLNGLKPGPQPEAGKEYCFPLASVNAMLTVGKQLVFSEGDIQDLKEKIFEDFTLMNMPPDVYKRSMEYGEAVAKHILDWSKTDNYAQTRSAPKFTIDTKDPSRWRPTPPQYADALEPHWRTIRPWVLDSANQFKCDPHQPFSTAKGSAFHKEAMEVYEIVKNLTPWQDSTAWYWDDNPFRMDVSGHLMVGVKKISPGGHWMNIASHACRKANADMMLSAETYVKVACALVDGFISCWYAKYEYNLIRPESYINQYIDPEWSPLIQTPPFPEHSSGHSTISAAAATVLTNLYGDNFSFTDSTEMEFGIPPRTFASFKEASEEVGMSRLYGGIHYRTGNLKGLKNGYEVGQYVSEKVKTRKGSKAVGSK